LIFTVAGGVHAGDAGDGGPRDGVDVALGVAAQFRVRVRKELRSQKKRARARGGGVERGRKRGGEGGYSRGS
jgi:hypothetical protein